MLEKVKRFYEAKYKKLLIIPFLMLFLALMQVGYQFASTGEFMNRGVSLKGGISVAIPEHTMPIIELQEIFNNNYPKADISVRSISQTGLLIEASDLTQEQVLQVLKEQFPNLQKGDYSVGELGSALGESFFRETIFVLFLSFILMGVVVFITFRVPAPSLAVILAAFCDIVVTLAVVNMMGIKISSAGIAAFLMLIGYSVDTDVLLSTRVLRRTEGTVMDGVYSAIRTGFMMTSTTLVALLAGLFLANNDTIFQIMLILFIGLIVDLIMTWIQNVGVLRLYIERKEKSQKATAP